MNLMRLIIGVSNSLELLAQIILAGALETVLYLEQFSQKLDE